MIQQKMMQLVYHCQSFQLYRVFWLLGLRVVLQEWMYWPQQYGMYGGARDGGGAHDGCDGGDGGGVHEHFH